MEYFVEPPDISHLVTEDETPVDGIFSEKQMRLLTESLYTSWPGPGDGRSYVAMANVGLFFSVHEPPLVPDVLVSLDVRAPLDPFPKENRSYFIWLYGKPPDVVVEIVSNRKGKELGDKLLDYARGGVSYYVVYDPDGELGSQPLHVYARQISRLAAIEAMWLAEVGLGLTLWTGEYEGMHATWLRWCDQEGRLYATGAEKAEQERQRADQAQQRRARASTRRGAGRQAPRAGHRSGRSMTVRRRVIFLFLDGVGLGSADPAINPLAVTPIRHCTTLLDHHPPVLATGPPFHALRRSDPDRCPTGRAWPPPERHRPGSHPDRHQRSPTPGRALRSAPRCTCARRAGRRRHFPAPPRQRLRALFLQRLSQALFRCCRTGPAAVERRALCRGQRADSNCSPMQTSWHSVRWLQISPMSPGAIVWAIPTRPCSRQLGPGPCSGRLPSPTISSSSSTGRLTCWVTNERWMQQSRCCNVSTVFLPACSAAADLEHTLIIVSSDHGNVEDCSHGKHTEKPSFTLLAGAERRRAVRRSYPCAHRLCAGDLDFLGCPERYIPLAPMD